MPTRNSVDTYQLHQGALLCELNANVVHRWRREARETAQTLSAFVPLTLEAPVPPAQMPTATTSSEIRVELEHNGRRVNRVGEGGVI